MSSEPKPTEPQNEMRNDCHLLSEDDIFTFDNETGVCSDPVFISKHWFPDDGQIHD